jgi:rhodanese-related sulfurtransferase
VKGSAKNTDSYANISMDPLASLMDDNDFALVNVHTPCEGRIPQIDLFIPFDEVQGHLDELPSKESTIVLYCRNGSMSTATVKVLDDEGHTNIIELDGGFSSWEQAGYELLDKR